MDMYRYETKECGERTTNAALVGVCSATWDDAM